MFNLDTGVALALFHANKIGKTRYILNTGFNLVQLSIFQKVPSVLMHFHIHGPFFEGLVFEAATVGLRGNAFKSHEFESFQLIRHPCLLMPSPFSSELLL